MTNTPTLAARFGQTVGFAATAIVVLCALACIAAAAIAASLRFIGWVFGL